MSKEEEQNKAKGALDRFEPGSEQGPINDRNEYEQQLSSLAPEPKQLAEESTRFADLCQCFSQQSMDPPAHVVEQVGRLSMLPVPERIRALMDINQSLMEYLYDVGQDPGIRQ